MGCLEGSCSGGERAVWRKLYKEILRVGTKNKRLFKKKTRVYKDGDAKDKDLLLVWLYINSVSDIPINLF